MHGARHEGWEAYVRREADLDERLRRTEGRGIRGRSGPRRQRRKEIRRRRLMALLFILGLALTVVLALALSGCGYGDEVTDAGPITTSETTEPEDPDTGTESSTTTTEAGETTDSTAAGELEVNVYFPGGDDFMIGTASRLVPQTRQTAQAAMAELLRGPSQLEAEQAKMSTAIPDGTALLGVDIDPDGTATVDLSKEFASGGGTTSMTMRLAQVVYTLTQFPTVDQVSFMLDGEPVTVFGGEGILLEEPVGRDYFEDVTPAILVENPAVGETVTSPLRLTGTANTFEATFQVNVTNWDGEIVKEETVTATSGTGTRGTFDVTLEFDPKQPDAEMLGAVIVFTNSARDGSQENVVEVPIKIRKTE